MGEHKKELCRLSVSAILFAAVWAVTAMIKLPLWGVILLFAVPYLIAGAEVLTETAENILHLEFFDEAFLMTVATLGAFVIGEYPEAVFVMLLFGVGELFEEISTEKSRRSVAELMDLRPDRATLETPDGETTVSPEVVKVGDIITVKPGERIPLDGVVLSGESEVDTAVLTGEALPRPLAAGDRAVGGCINLTGLLRIRVTETLSESTAAKILRSVENAADQKSRPERFLTKFAKIYTPAVVLAAVLLAVVGGAVSGDPAEWLRRALMCLVASCPCALVVSVPLSYFCGIGAASKKGILIKGASALETLSRTKTVAFDKTGTLTGGEFSVTAVHPDKISPEALLRLAAVAEAQSNHPIARSVRAAVPSSANQKPEAFTEFPGKGVAATVDGRQVTVGNAAWTKSQGICCPDCPHDGTVLHLTVDGEYMGHLAVSDTVKPTAATAISRLKADGITPVILTGDRKEPAEKIAQTVGVEKVFAELLPDQKITRLEALLSPESATLFVGDGINDAPVLARADLGVAMGAFGSDAALEAADAVLMDDDPAKLPVAITLARKTAGIVRQNIWLTLSVKALVLVPAMLGAANLWWAVGADVGVLMLAILNATRAGKA